MALVINTGSSFAANMVDFMLPVADDGSMRNCKDPTRNGTLTNGATYTTSLITTCPGHTAAVSFNGSDDYVQYNKTHSMSICSHFWIVHCRGTPGAIEGMWHHREDGENNGHCAYLNTTLPNLVSDGVGAESIPPATIAADLWYAFCDMWNYPTEDPQLWSARLDSSDNFAGEQAAVSDIDPVGTPEVMQLGTYRGSFSMDGLMCVHVSWTDKKTLAFMDDFLDLARLGYTGLLQNDAVARPPFTRPTRFLTRRR